MKTKVSIITTVTLLMGFGFFMMARKGIWVPCIIIPALWVCHVICFVFDAKTIRTDGAAEKYPLKAVPTGAVFYKTSCNAA